MQCAHQLGAYVVTTSSSQDFARLKALGADACFAYDEIGRAHLRERFEEVGFDHLIDTSGRVSLAENVSLLAINGQITMITAPSDTSFNALDFYTKGKSIQGFVFSRADAHDLAQNAERLNAYFKKGLLLEDEVAFYTFSDVARLQDKIEKEGARGKKYVLRP